MARPFLLGGQHRTGEGTFEVHDPLDGSVVDQVASPTDADIHEAIAVAAEAFRTSRTLPSHVRIDALDHVSRRLAERQDHFAELIAREGGKPLKWARSEAARAVSTFRIAAEEVRRDATEAMRLDTEAALGSRLGIIRRFPLGPVLAIAPFNFPLNLVAHKVAPAIAVGAPFIVKPSDKTPLSALELGALVAETDLPPGMVTVLPIGGARAGALVEDPRLPVISFTGSSEVGWNLRAQVPRKRLVLELGGNAGVIVHGDADLDHAAQRITFGGYYQAGQSCISVQRVLVQSQVFDAFCDRLAKHVAGLRVGATLDPDTDVGPLIEPDALDRIDGWVREAIEGGARALVGGQRRDPFYEPTVLVGVEPEMKVCREEIFGPVTTVRPYETFEEALAEVNDSPYGLQAGVFTRDLERAFLAHRELEVGGVIVNDQSAYRADQMPYGGSKDSGIGREGPRYAMEDYTEPRILVISDLPL